jgi:hypothetical protein
MSEFSTGIAKELQKQSFNNNSKRSSFDHLSRGVCGEIKEP